MRKKKMRLYIPLLILVILALGIYWILERSREDHIPPQIDIDSDIINISVTDGNAALLDGVTAQDNRDGDVTGLLLVEKVSDLDENHTATVTYAAFDHSGNVAKATRTVCYVDYAPPVFSLNKPLVFNIGSTADLVSRVQVTDVLDGNISRNLKATIVSDSNLSTAGVHEVSFRVTNSMGDTVRITLPVDVLPTGTYTGSIKLKENLIYLPTGEAFNPNDYFAAMTLGVAEYTLTDGVQLSFTGNVDTTTPGIYSIAYTAVYNNSKAFTRLIVVVE